MSSGQINPILSIAIKAMAHEDREVLERAISALVESSPVIKVEIQSSNGNFIIRGEDEVQLEEICSGIQRSTTVEIGKPQVIYLETLRKTAEAEGKYIRQTGGAGNYGHCKLLVEPNTPGAGYEFISDMKPGVVPQEYIKSIDEGVQGALEAGALAGFPIVDVKVTLFGGSYHDVDSNEMAFEFAGSMAFKEAARKASPVLLEPVMAVEVTVPEELMGEIIGDINARRGRIVNIDHRSSAHTIDAIVPLAEVLRSSAHGRPVYSMRFAGYEATTRQGGIGGDDATIPVGKPRGPRPRDGSVAAEWEQ